MTDISRQQLEEKMDQEEDFLLVETLGEDKYNHSHLPGAVNLPPGSLRQRAEEVLPDKGADIVLYCASPN